MHVAQAVLTIQLLTFGNAAGDKRTSQEIEQIREELSELRAEVAALRSAISEAARLDRRRADMFERLVQPGTPANVEAPSVKPSAPIATSKSKSEGSKSSRRAPSLTRRTTRQSTPSSGGVTGRVTVPDGEPVAYVYVENVRGRLAEGKLVQIDQKGKQFLPGWAVIERGTRVEFPNYDNIFHNVFSRSPGNAFDLGLYRAGEGPKQHRFLKGGSVDVFCNMHPNMSAHILVVPNQHYVRVKADGSFELGNVPTGRRKVVAWSPGTTPVSTWVDVEGEGSATVELALVKRSRGHLNKHGRPYGSYP